MPTKKTVKSENIEIKTEMVTKKETTMKIKMLKSYIGRYGRFYLDKEYTVPNDIGICFIKNKDAEQC